MELNLNRSNLHFYHQFANCLGETPSTLTLKINTISSNYKLRNRKLVRAPKLQMSRTLIHLFRGQFVSIVVWICVGLSLRLLYYLSFEEV